MDRSGNKRKHDLKNILKENFFGSCPDSSDSTKSKKRRTTIHGNEIKYSPCNQTPTPTVKEPESTNQLATKTKGSRSFIKRRSTSSAAISNNARLTTCLESSVAAMVSQPDINLSTMVKGTLKRRVSSSLLRHKMKNRQDYSLPSPIKAVLKETDSVPPPPPPRRSPRLKSSVPISASRSVTATPPTSAAARIIKATPTTAKGIKATPPASTSRNVKGTIQPVSESRSVKATPPPKPPRQRLPRTPASSVKDKFKHSPVWKRLSQIRQVNLQQLMKDHDLQQKIEHEIKMREGTARLLAASKHPPQMLEAAKNLLSSNTRIIAYMTELQRRKTAEVLGKQTTVEGNQLPCRAQVSVSDIRIPLMWKDVDHFKNKGDYRRYAVFCMLKVGTEIYDTVMISDVDRTMTDITFEDVILFEEVAHDFDMTLEVYCHKLHEEFSVANTPKKIRKKINDISGSVGRSVGKRLSGLNDADVIGNMVLGPKFELVAKGTLSLSDVDNSVRTFDLQLEKNSEGQEHELPLFGHYCCRLAALPRCLVQATVTGFLNVQEDDDLSKWKRYWCSLKNLQLACWSSPGDVEVTQPLLTIPVTKSTQISDADPSTCKQANTFLIKSVKHDGTSQHTLAAESKEDLSRWWDGFQQHLLDQALWKHACEEHMDLRVSLRRRGHHFTRKSSLYEETPLIEPENNSESSMGSDLGLADDQLSQMLQTLMGEANQIRGGASSH